MIKDMAMRPNAFNNKYNAQTIILLPDGPHNAS